MYHDRGWVVDWHVGLTEAEQQFVREHVWNFCVTYQADGREPLEPPIDRAAVPVPGMGAGDSIVAELTEQAGSSAHLRLLVLRRL